MAKNIRPLQDRILVKQMEEEEKTSGGIIIPETAKEKPQRAEVIAVGGGKRLSDGNIRPLDVSVGDQVLYEKFAGSNITIDGEEYMILREDEVLAVLAK